MKILLLIPLLFIVACSEKPTSRTVECDIPGFGKKVFKQVRHLEASITYDGVKIVFIDKKSVWLYGKNIVCIIQATKNKEVVY